MLLKKYRLKNKSAFTATYHVKKSYHKGGVTLFVGKKKSSTDIITKVGFVVSKKTHKRAVKRNRVKRLMRESFRLLQKENNLYSSQEYLSLIFIASERALGKNFNDIKSSIECLLKLIKMN